MPTQEVPAQSPAALSIRHLTKTFGGTRALDDVSLDVAPGTVHGLVGENGSGKSTLIKTLSGYHVPESGSEIAVRGENVTLPISAADLKRLGLRFVHQDLTLAPTLTVAENLFVDELTTSPNWMLRSSVLRRRAREQFAHYGRAIDPAARVGSLSAADQAHVAIVRALSRLHDEDSPRRWRPGVLVLDEVTAFLSSSGRAQLFQLIRDIAGHGDSVLFVSHYLDEVLEITSTVTVLRDGKLVTTMPTSETDSDGLVELIIGRNLSSVADRGTSEGSGRGAIGTSGAKEAERGFEVTGLTGAVIQDLDFVIRPGEVLGVSGLMGSGFAELPALLFGAIPAVAGRARFGPREFELSELTPNKATSAGIAFVPEDRHRAGSVGGLTVEENMTLQVIDAYQHGALRRRRLRRDVRALLEEYDVRPRDPGALMARLSGGNQQKVLMAKWLITKPSVLLLHEPTHGVDVGSREQILRRVRDVAIERGMPVLCASSDPEQLSDFCDRVLVLARGRVVAELADNALTQDAIVESSYLTTSDLFSATIPEPSRS